MSFSSSKILLTLALLISTLNLSAQVEDLRAKMNLSVMTWNIRYDNPADGNNAWSNRQERVISLIKETDPDLIGMQEVLESQLKTLKKELKGYAFVGVGRDDGKKAGEFNPIFYRKSQFKLLNSGTFWLSPDPETPGSKGWEAACPRIVTWARLEILGTGKVFYHFNTHFDHQSQEARYQSAAMLSEYFRKLPEKPHFILTGDLNEEPNGPVYTTLTANGDYNYLVDTRLAASSKSGPRGTFTGFEVGAIPSKLIDYVFLRKFRNVVSYRVLDEQKDGFYPSDHLPVLVKMVY
ncbi:MAG: endonuclease/exonuclease/phosphatase family protein [Bacteroidia bacterium]|nr:endonuclease/exonuclease/phosphatase family protein [Bacteroidia bacterium]